MKKLLLLTCLSLLPLSVFADEDLAKIYSKKIADCTNLEGYLYKEEPGSKVPKGQIRIGFSAKEWPANEVLFWFNDEPTGVVPVVSDAKGFEYTTQYHDGNEVQVKVRKGKKARIIIDPDIAIEKGGYLDFECTFKI